MMFVGYSPPLRLPCRDMHIVLSCQKPATLAALMNRTINETANAGLYVQSMWQSGNVSRFELVDTFFDTLFPHDDIVMTKNFDDILPKMNILVTTQRYGYQIIQPKTRSELKDVIRKTSWV